MVLLIEQERSSIDESNVYSFPTPINFAVTLTDLLDSATAPDWPDDVITVGATQLVAYTFQVVNPESVPKDFKARLKFGGNPFFITGGAGGSVTIQAGETLTFGGVLSLAAGSYAVVLDGLASAVTVYVQNFSIGLCGFVDVSKASAAPYTTGLVVDLSSQRLTPLGKIAYGTMIISATAATAGAVTHMNDIGDSLTNGVNLFIDGVQENWSTVAQDEDSSGNGACGTYIVQKPAVSVVSGSSYTITITKANANTVVNISVVFCPWILPIGGTLGSTYFPVSPLTFSQGSTLYCNLEPLFIDATKYFLVGKKRAVSFGDASDYYYYPSGTGILACTFTFEIPDVASVSVFAYGWGGCINQVGVDTK
jgi:hypothetical protein